MAKFDKRPGKCPDNSFGNVPCDRSGVVPERKRQQCCEEYDLIIVGAGPSGLFCAINSSHKDKNILVLEKKKSPGRKLLVSGSGHCNITHDGDIRSFLGHYGDHGRFLRPALLGFTNQDLVSFFENKGLGTILAEGGKIFPESLRSKDVLDVLVRECDAKDVHIRHDQNVKSIIRSKDGFEVVTEDYAYRSQLLVIATGGRSYPATGSDGAGYGFAKSLGHNITDIGPALTPVRIKDYPFLELAGISFPKMEISLYRGKKIKEYRGDVLFTHQGLSGPGILDLSRHIKAKDTLKLSFVQVKSRAELEEWLLDKVKVDGARGIKSIIADLSLPNRVTTKIIELSGILPGMKCAHLTRDMRGNLLDNLTGFPMTVEAVEGFNVAMATRGGVDLKEVNSKTMGSRLVDGLYLAGEVLDIDGDTGGYNLQAAFSTGMLAAKSILQRWAKSVSL